MGFNVVCSLILVLLGGAVEIYSFSNVGYTVSFLPVLIGYYLLRQDKPHLRRPFKLPEFMKYVALALAAIFFVFWLFGGLWYSKIGNVQIYYWLGWATLLAYLPLYWYRVYVEDKRNAAVGSNPQSRVNGIRTGANLAPVSPTYLVRRTSLEWAQIFSDIYEDFTQQRRLPPRFFTAFGPFVVAVALS